MYYEDANKEWSSRATALNVRRKGTVTVRCARTLMKKTSNGVLFVACFLVAAVTAI